MFATVADLVDSVVPLSIYPFRTALVTGASSGIGEALARELAADGVAVTLVARRRDRLDHICAQLPGSSVLEADLSTASGIDIVAAHIERRKPDLVVNNAGFGISQPLQDIGAQRLAKQIAVNVTAVTLLTQAALPAMRSARRGWILNVSSVAGGIPVPNGGVYSATKAYVTNFTESLAMELADTGVVATALLPGYTRTQFHEAAGMTTEVSKIPNLAWLTAERVAKESLAACAAGELFSIPGRRYRATTAVTRYMPRRAVRWVIARQRP